MLFSPQNSIIGESQINEMLGTCVVGLTVSGNWSNTQYAGTAVDYTGLSFIAIYSNGTISSVTPTSVSPSVWGSTVGTQTATFTYTENRFSVTVSKDASVEPAIPVSLSISGDWSNPQYIGQAVDYTGLVFIVTYSDGNSSVVTPTSLSPSTWSSTVGTQSCTFSYTEDGVTVSASKSAEVVSPWNGKPVGGTIFYINTSSTNTYKFHNANDEEVSAPSVGTDCTGWTYEVTGSGVDKFYVYNPSAMFKRDRTGTQTYPYVAWTYLDTTNQSYIDNKSYTSGLPSGRTEWSYYGYKGRVYETLNGTYTGTAIGTGKSNTSNMLSLRNGAYNQSSQIKWKSQSQYSETIWYVCDQFNKGTYSLNGSPVPNNTGCDDWYIPSKDELETMKNAIGASTFASMLYSGDISSALILPWSSSTYSNVNHSWSWAWNRGNDYGMLSYDRYRGDYSHCLAFSRSF